MRLLLDHDVWEATAAFLESEGHDVLRVRTIGLAQASDEDLLQEAAKTRRVFVTRDRDFGSLVFVKKLGAGVLYLRIRPSTQNTVHRHLADVLKRYTGEELARAFVVIEVNGHRFRRVVDG